MADYACPGHSHGEMCLSEVECMRRSTAEYVSAQAHHLYPSWREWLMKRFRLEDCIPGQARYGVRLAEKGQKA